MIRPDHALAVPEDSRCARPPSSCKGFVCVELNMGQMVEDVQLAVDVQAARSTSAAAPAA